MVWYGDWNQWTWTDNDAVGDASWIWRGNDHLGNLVPSGQYILEVAWQGSEMRTIRRSRCLITVSPP